MKSIASLLVLLGAVAYAADVPTPKTATKDAPFVNSLGMKFVPVPGTKVLFSIWDTRVKDFRAYAKAADYHQMGGIYLITAYRCGQGLNNIYRRIDGTAGWENPGFAQTEDHPVVGVSWWEAKAFCAWLSKRENRAYRLPTDTEWVAAVGKTKYPWGDTWPPPKGAGNFGDKAFYETFHHFYKSEFAAYDDGYTWTSPVGAFSANGIGLYDMAGNVLQWCEDRRDREVPGSAHSTECRVLRGSCWEYVAQQLLLCEQWKEGPRYSEPTERDNTFGFRCVLELPTTPDSTPP